MLSRQYESDSLCTKGLDKLLLCWALVDIKCTCSHDAGSGAILQRTLRKRQQMVHHLYQPATVQGGAGGGWTLHQDGYIWWWVLVFHSSGIIRNCLPAKKYNELFPKTKKESTKKEKAPKKEEPKKKKEPEPVDDEEDEPPPEPAKKFVDPYADMPKRWDTYEELLRVNQRCNTLQFVCSGCFQEVLFQRGHRYQGHPVFLGELRQRGVEHLEGRIQVQQRVEKDFHDQQLGFWDDAEARQAAEERICQYPDSGGG